MTVTSCYGRRLADEKNVLEFLQSCQKKCQGTDDSLIISVTQSISFLEPLTILQRFTSLEQRHFYWENQQQNYVMASWDTCLEKKITSGDRFSQIQQLINDYKHKIVTLGETNFPEVGVKFFTSFTFFDQDTALNRDTSPFRSMFPQGTIFIPKWQITRYESACFFTANFQLSAAVNLINLYQEIKDKLSEIEKINRFSVTVLNLKNCHINHFKQHHQFKTAVKSALNDIHENQLSKVVLAHYLDVVCDVPFQPFLSLEYLRETYKGCYIFSMGNGEETSFIGATPERLFSLRNQKLISDALAGSAPRGKNLIIDRKLTQNLLNSEKEKREHQAVRHYIIRQLEQLGLTPHASQRRVLKLSNIQHLWTVIKADLCTEINPLEIVAKLHPTPAVAGVPSAIACEKIRQYETFDRSLYAAPIGWLDPEGNAEFIVGIRSAMINKNQARLYAGAGIVAGSNPDQELAEVELKLQTMLTALR